MKTMRVLTDQCGRPVSHIFQLYGAGKLQCYYSRRRVELCVRYW